MAKVEYILDKDLFDESIKEIAKLREVIDLGSAVRFHKQLEKYRYLFKENHYYALDLNFDQDLDIIADIQNLPVRSSRIEGIICKDVLYWLPEPLEAVEEMYRILKKGGLVFISVPFLYPYHASETRKDLYRFTKDGLEYMFRNFSEMKLQPWDGGGYINTLFSFMTGFKFRNQFFMNLLGGGITDLIGFLRGRAINRLHNPTGFNILLKK